MLQENEIKINIRHELQKYSPESLKTHNLAPKSQLATKFLG